MSKSAIRQAYWEDYMRRTAQALAVRHIDLPIKVCVSRAVELADAVEEAIETKFPRNAPNLHAISLPPSDDLLDSEPFVPELDSNIKSVK